MSDDTADRADQAPSTGLAAVRLSPVTFGALAILAAMLVLSGGPTVFSDTGSYFNTGGEFYGTVAKTLGLGRLEQPPPTPDEAAQREVSRRYERTIMAARSPWYGVLLWPLERIGTIWLVAIVQSFLAAWLIFLMWRTLASGAPAWTAYAVPAATAGLSTLPLVAGFAMPDIFGPFLVMSMALLAACWNDLRTWERGALAVLIGYCVVAHGANAALALGLLAILASWAFLTGRARRQIASLSLIACAIATAMAANAVSQFAEASITGQGEGKPPFLAARLIADGPGRDYLREACAHGYPYLLCHFKDLPLTSDNDILWSRDPALGVFNTLAPSSRIDLEKEEIRFVFSAIRSRPWSVLRASLSNWSATLAAVQADGPLADRKVFFTDPNLKLTVLPGMISRARTCGPDRDACRPPLTQPVSAWLQPGEFILALLACGWFACTRGRQDRRWLALLAIVTVALVLNAAICGVLVGPYARYQSRLTWLMTAAFAVGPMLYWARRRT